MEAVPGPRRITLAKDALTSLVDAASQNVAFDFVTFAPCGPPQHRGHYPADRRAELKQAIRNTALNDSTSLAEAIRALPSLVARRSAGQGQAINVVLVSDGFDSCGGDPCAAAAAVERQRSDIDINVVAVSRAIEGLNCISRNTGGKFFQPRDTSQVAQLLARAAGQASPDSCR
nr:vWA domain-containing protein [Azospirillum oleiclasticum]